jgi:hypothetical protein
MTYQTKSVRVLFQILSLLYDQARVAFCYNLSPSEG